MGFYINPPDMTKETWLAKHGKEIDLQTAVAFKAKGADHRVVCLVDNGDFTAAGIAHVDAERDHFAMPDITSGYQRPRRWYLVSVENLKPFWQP